MIAARPVNGNYLLTLHHLLTRRQPLYQLDQLRTSRVLGLERVLEDDRFDPVRAHFSDLLHVVLGELRVIMLKGIVLPSIDELT